MTYDLFREPHRFVHVKKFGLDEFYVRSVLEKDLAWIFKWVNMPYAKKFWQMQGSLKELTQYYQRQKEENITSSFVVCDGICPIAVFEVYQALRTELAQKYEARPQDYGIHLLMAPYDELIRLKPLVNKISEKVLFTIIDMLFTFNSVNRILAEPDVRNNYAHKLAEKAGFEYRGDIQLTDKIARFYMLSKEQFIKLKQV